MSQPRFGSANSSGRRESNTAVAGVGVAGAGALGARLSLNRMRSDSERVANARGLVQTRAQFRGAAATKLRGAYEARNAAAERANIGYQTGEEGFRTKKLVGEFMKPSNVAFGRAKGDARQAGRLVREAKAGVKAAQKGRWKGRAGFGAGVGLAALGAGMTAAGAWGVERSRNKARDRSRVVERQALSNVTSMDDYRANQSRGGLLQDAQGKPSRVKRPVSGRQLARVAQVIPDRGAHPEYGPNESEDQYQDRARAALSHGGVRLAGRSDAADAWLKAHRAAMDEPMPDAYAGDKRYQQNLIRGSDL